MKKNYRIIRSKRRTIAITITPEGEVVVKAPYGISSNYIRDFVDSKSEWIESTCRRLIEERFIDSFIKPFSEEELNTITGQAKILIPPRVDYYASLLGVSYNRITFRRQRSRWGSCSTKGNLNFNILLVLLPQEVMDYVIVHELCHLLEMNHSKAFWRHVESILPNYCTHRKYLSDNGRSLTARLG